MFSRGQCLVAMVVAMCLVTQQSVAFAQARELGNPRRPSVVQTTASQADEFGDAPAPRDRTATRARRGDTTVPTVAAVHPVQVARPATAARDPQGRIRVRFEGDSNRHLVVTQLLATSRATARMGLNQVTATGESYGLVCRLACDAYLDPGAYRFGIGHDAYPDYRSGIIQISQPTQINVQYDDHGVLRIIGMVVMLLGAGAGILGFWSLVQDEPDYALAGAITGGIALFTGLGLLFASDGVHFTSQPLR